MKTYIINLPKDKERREFQEKQLKYFHIYYEFINAVSTSDISLKTYEEHKYDWQRPLRDVEVACYYSHQHLWQKIINSNKPALILEDDVLVSKHLPEILTKLSSIQNIDYVNLEVVGRKKLISKESHNISLCHSKLYRLYLDRNGAGGYVLYPSGAKKLLDLETKIGIGLSDSHINSCYNLLAYQIEPASIIQFSQCALYGMTPPLDVKSNIDTLKKPKISIKDKLHFSAKRISAQIRQGIQFIIYIFQGEKREIKIDKEDFIFLKNKDTSNE